jgi:hypothetical protein
MNLHGRARTWDGLLVSAIDAIGSGHVLHRNFCNARGIRVREQGTRINFFPALPTSLRHTANAEHCCWNWQYEN